MRAAFASFSDMKQVNCKQWQPPRGNSLEQQREA
jgi:hypothetical protein